MHRTFSYYIYMGKKEKQFTASPLLFLAALHLSLLLACYFTKQECPIFKKWKAVRGVEVILIHADVEKKEDLLLFPYDKRKPSQESRNSLSSQRDMKVFRREEMSSEGP